MDFDGGCETDRTPTIGMVAIMWDLGFVLLTLLFFLVSAAYVAGCDRLQ